MPRTLQRTNVDGPQASVAHELRHRLLCLLVVPGDQHVERLACDLAFNEGSGEGGVEGLDDPRVRRERRRKPLRPPSLRL
jgi:hypothetical protein